MCIRDSGYLFSIKVLSSSSPRMSAYTTPPNARIWNWTLEKIPLFGFSCEESEFEVTKVQHQHQQKLGNSEFNSIERFLKQLRKLKREHLHVQSDAGCGRRTGAKTNASLRRVRERQRPRVSYTVFFLDIYIESRTTRYDDRQHLQFCG